MTEFKVNIPIAEGAPTLDDMKGNARAAYTNAFNDIIERVIDEFILPADRIQMLYDIAQFTTFLCASKIPVIKGEEPSRERMMAAYWPFQKALKDEVPGMLRELADEIAPPRGRINDPI